MAYAGSYLWRLRQAAGSDLVLMPGAMVALVGDGRRVLVVEREALVPFGSLSEADLHTIRYPNGDLTHCFALLLLARSWTGESKLDPGEAVEAQFADLDSPPAPLHTPTAHALGLLREFLASGRFQLR